MFLFLFNIIFSCLNYFFFKSFLFFQVFNSCRQSHAICMWKPFSLLHRLANGISSPHPPSTHSPLFLERLVEPCTWTAAISGLGVGCSFLPPSPSSASPWSCNSKNWSFLLLFNGYCWGAYLWFWRFLYPDPQLSSWLNSFLGTSMLVFNTFL